MMKMMMSLDTARSAEEGEEESGSADECLEFDRKCVERAEDEKEKEEKQ
jgi:hypothetical protein